MPILQHYYTSFVDGRTGEGGFRTKAATPGLRPDVQNAVLRLIAYRIPPTADERVLESHPVALRYVLLNPSEAVVSCVQSCGTDENGRPGNVFAHSLVASPAELPAHPIALWGHPAWRRADPSDRSELPELPTLGRAPAPDAAALARFLAEGRRGEWFVRMLDAVAHSGGPGGRRVVVVDDAEHVALWIAALSLALPTSVRPRLTFSTYHHDPYQAPFVITGTTRDSSFRLSPQDFLQYFVVDAAGGRTSDSAPPGPFAELAAQPLLAGEGADALAPFHAFCDRRGGDEGLDGGLDRLARLWQRLGQPPEAAPGEEEVALLRTALRDMVRTGVRTAEDRADLTLLADTVRPLLVPARDPGLLDAYCDAIGAAGEADRLYLDDDLATAARLACGGRADEAGRLLASLGRALGVEAVRAQSDTAEFAALLVHAAGGKPASLAAAWASFGPLRSLTDGDPLLEAAFAALDEASPGGADEPPNEVLPLLSALRTAAAGRETVLLQRALEWRRENGGPSTEWLYYRVAGELSLEERRAYRALVEADVDDIASYEVQCDLRRTRPEGVRPLLGAWTSHMRDPSARERVMAAALGHLWGRAEDAARPTLALELLGWEELAPLVGARWEETLVRTAFADLHTRLCTDLELGLLSRFAAHPALPPDARTVMEMRMATTQGTLDPSSISRLQKRLAGLAAESYHREVAPLLARFVSPDVPLAEYANAVRAAYVREHDALFWTLHWEALSTAVSSLPAPGITTRLPFGLGRSGEVDAATERFGAWLVAFLEFWFDRAMPLVEEHAYLGPRFFLSLPGALDDLQRVRPWRPLARVVERRAGAAPWYPFVEKWFVPRPAAPARPPAKEHRNG